MGDDRSPVYREGDLLVVRGSAFGTCLWDLIAIGQGHTPDEWPANILRAFKEGQDGETEVLARLEAMGWVLDHDFAQSEHDLRVGRSTVVRYHPDGAGLPATQPTIRHLLEVKRLHNSSWLRIRKHGVGGLTEGQKWQVSVEMVDQKLPLAFVVDNKGETPDKETGVRPPCPHEGELHIVWITEPPYSRAQVLKRARELRDAIDDDDVLTCGRVCDNPQQWPCRFRELRILPEGAETAGEPVGPEKVAEFDRLCAVENLSAEVAKHAEADRKKAKAELRVLAGDAEALHSGDWEWELAPSGTQTTTNWAQLEKDMADKGLLLSDYQETKDKAKTMKVRSRW